MGKSLVIVESPTKAKTIARFLGGDFVIESSFGHIRDLPTYELGVDVDHQFEPKYVIPRKAQKQVKKLKEEAKKADRIILATDEDREGEAIAWHLQQALKPTEPKKSRKKKPAGDAPPEPAPVPPPELKTERIVFHEITKKAIEDALLHPRTIDEKLVNAQQARRILDRLVGYKLSPFLWKKVTRGLSAGRVQSVAVRLIVEREREIQAFKPEEYWTLEGVFKKNNSDMSFPAQLVKIDDLVLEKFSMTKKEDSDRALEDLAGAPFVIAHIEKRSVTKNPLPPFTTSTLQQEAWKRLRFSAKQTMLIAQQLYEGIELGEGPVGLITYMRTDSVNLSEESLQGAKAYLDSRLGSSYSLPQARRFKTKSKGAQEAHEAIRPSDPARDPESVKAFLNKNQFRLYDLVWRRFIGSQMPPGIFDGTTVDLIAHGTRSTSEYTFRAHGQTVKFDGFLKIYHMRIEDVLLPELSKDDALVTEDIKALQHYTEPPPRYTEASLVKSLEKFGIGRPSTYAPIMSTIQDRGYIIKNEQKRFTPTEIGLLVNDMLVEHFPRVVDIAFTARMEEELDEIAEGTLKWQNVIGEFYAPFAKNLAEKFEAVEKEAPKETTDEICPKCGKPMAVKFGRFGKFLACTGFPECKSTKPLHQKVATNTGQKTDMACPKCVEGFVVVKRTRRGKIFFGCSRYPACNFASWGKPIGEKCPKCENPLIEIKYGIKCNNKDCDYKMKKEKPAAEETPMNEVTE